jgi:cytochrome c-type biogenesis protein CcmE
MKPKHILIIIIIAIALGVIVSTFVNTSTYANFSEAAKYPGKEFHVIGKLDRTQPIIYDTKTDANKFSFFMIDEKGLKKKVIHNNIKPQDFEKSEQVVVIGKMEADSFIASSLLLKCPSKYKDDKKPKEFGEKAFVGKK